MGNLDGNGLTGAEVRALVDGSHAAAGNQPFNLKVVELLASVDADHG
jgi:hypothetical protein